MNGFLTDDDLTDLRRRLATGQASYRVGPEPHWAEIQAALAPDLSWTVSFRLHDQTFVREGVAQDNIEPDIIVLLNTILAHAKEITRIEVP